MSAQLLVAVIDDDESVRESLPDLLTECGFAVHAFGSAEAFLDAGDLNATRCLILDIAMPGMDGPALHRELQRRGYPIPVIFITAHGDGTERPKLIAQGAVDCLRKPFSEADLLRALSAALRIG